MSNLKGIIKTVISGFTHPGGIKMNFWEFNVWLYGTEKQSNKMWDKCCGDDSKLWRQK